MQTRNMFMIREGMKVTWFLMLVIGLLLPLAVGCGKKKDGKVEKDTPPAKPALTFSCEGVANKALETKSGFAFGSTKTFSAPDGAGGFKSSEAAIHSYYLASFDLDAAQGQISLGADLIKDGQIRVSFGLVGAEGTKAGGKTDPPPATGEYTGAAEKFNQVSFVSITVFEGGKQVEHSFDKVTGSVKITNATAELIEGEIDVKDEKKAVKGPFKVKPAL